MTTPATAPTNTTAASTTNTTTSSSSSRNTTIVVSTIRNVLYDVFVFIMSLMGGIMINMCFMTINTQYLYPLPSHLNLRHPEHLQLYVQSLPVLAYVIVFVAHFGQCIVGSYIAVRRLRGTYRRVLVYTITLLTMMASIANNHTIINILPKWVWIEIPLYFVILYYMDRIWIVDRIYVPVVSSSEMKAKEHSD